MPREGATVVAMDIRVDEGVTLADRPGSKVTFVEHDVTREAQWQALLSRVAMQAGPQ